jgi:hypothetical protein
VVAVLVEPTPLRTLEVTVLRWVLLQRAAAKVLRQRLAPHQVVQAAVAKLVLAQEMLVVVVPLIRVMQVALAFLQVFSPLVAVAAVLARLAETQVAIVVVLVVLVFHQVSQVQQLVVQVVVVAVLGLVALALVGLVAEEQAESLPMVAMVQQTRAVAEAVLAFPTALLMFMLQATAARV